MLTPAIEELDITKPVIVNRFLMQHKIDAVIHCAAMARMSECEQDPVKAIKTNIIGTANLVNAVLKKQAKVRISIRFIYISTDGVYPGTKGNYSEKIATIPYNKYGWTKLGGECAVRLLENFCIIRTSFFDPGKIKFNCSARDIYSSRLPIDCLAKEVLLMLDSGFIGAINIGDKRKSDYQRYKKFKPELKLCNRRAIFKNINFAIARDSSLNSKLWKKIKKI